MRACFVDVDGPENPKSGATMRVRVGDSHATVEDPFVGSLGTYMGLEVRTRARC